MKSLTKDEYYKHLLIKNKESRIKLLFKILKEKQLTMKAIDSTLDEINILNKIKEE